MMMKRKHKITMIVIVAAVLAFFAVFAVWHRVFSGTNDGLPNGTVTIGDHEFSVELATTMTQQSRGLSGRTELAEDTGMLFLFKNPAVQNFWMKDMNFPIDIIWIGSDDKIAGFSANAQPQPGTPLFALTIYKSPAGVNTVLEVPAGTVARDLMKVGEAVSVQK